MARKKAGRIAGAYDVHPGVAMVQKWVAELPEKTGRSLDQWISLLKRQRLRTEAQREWLKREHGMGANSAWWIVERAADKAEGDEDPKAYLKMAAQYVEDMYAEAKSGLRPMHDVILKLGRSLGKDVRVCPCKTIVPLYRNHVFAEIKPSTRTRIDLGLALKKAPRKPPKRFIDTGGLAKGDRITHRVPIHGLDDIDDEVERWLKIAYEADGE